jgi:hypothetical protein
MVQGKFAGHDYFKYDGYNALKAGVDARRL